MDSLKKCSLCGKQFDFWDEQENFSLNRLLGYGTAYDSMYLNLHLCCDCMDKLINDCKISPVADTGYDPDMPYDNISNIYIVGGYGDCVSNAKVYGLADSIRRAKYPKSVDLASLNSELTKGIKSLAQSKPGEGHDQWLTGVIVQFDLTFSIKAWTEAERYHFLDFVSSQSTMHRISKFDFDNTYNSYVDSRIVDIMCEKLAKYNELDNEDSGALKKDAYLSLLYSNPTGFRLTAGMTTNYRQLKTIYNQRKNHRLPEWRDFCKWIETLPLSELITGDIPVSVEPK